MPITRNELREIMIFGFEMDLEEALHQLYDLNFKSKVVDKIEERIHEQPEIIKTKAFCDEMTALFKKTGADKYLDPRTWLLSIYRTNIVYFEVFNFTSFEF